MRPYSRAALALPFADTFDPRNRPQVAFGPFATPLGNGRLLRSPDGWSRREADIAGGGLERRSWPDSGRSRAAGRGRTRAGDSRSVILFGRRRAVAPSLAQADTGVAFAY